MCDSSPPGIPVQMQMQNFNSMVYFGVNQVVTDIIIRFVAQESATEEIRIRILVMREVHSQHAVESIKAY